MSLTFAIADLHGRADLLEATLATIEARVASGTFVFLGDDVDRGPKSKQVIARLVAGPSQGWEWVCLRGNHEEMMLRALTGSEAVFIERKLWMSNGGDATLRSYGDSADFVPDTHIDWLKGLPLMHVDLQRVYVHAAVDPYRPLHRQRESSLLWALYGDDEQGGHGDFHVVHGHHQFADGPVLKTHRTDLDTFAWSTGRLVVGVFDDDTPGGPVDFIEVIGEPARQEAEALVLPAGTARAPEPRS